MQLTKQNGESDIRFMQRIFAELEKNDSLQIKLDYVENLLSYFKIFQIEPIKFVLQFSTGSKFFNIQKVDEKSRCILLGSLDTQQQLDFKPFDLPCYNVACTKNKALFSKSKQMKYTCTDKNLFDNCKHKRSSTITADL